MGEGDLPADLRAVLTRLRVLEATVAGQGGRQRRVSIVSGRVMLAAHDAGWPIAWMAEVLAISASAASSRVQTARRERAAGGLHTGLAPVLPRRRGGSGAEPVPLDERPWLTMRELTWLLDIHPMSVRNWRKAGLLPNSVRTPGGRYRFAREDVRRLLRARVHYRPGRHDIHYAATRERLADLRPAGALDDRVQIIVELGLAGCTLAGIADYLGVSESTVWRVFQAAA